MTLIIAEAGVNHNGSLKTAKQLIDAASNAGADIIKFQTFQSRQIATKDAQQAVYQYEALGQKQSQLSMLEKLELKAEQHEPLIEYCQQKNIEFLSTAFDIPSIDLLSKLKIKRWKIPSGEITNLPYLRKIGAMKGPVILSTGMATLGEIESALFILEEAGTFRNDITILHCTTEYPAPLEEVNLRAMRTIAKAFAVDVGYSDHTKDIFVPVAATGMGATIIEKHLTLDQNMPGPDHKASLEPNSFATMVHGIRCVEQALGDGIKRPTVSELANMKVARKSLVAARPIRCGELFSTDNLTAKRPGTGISPMHWEAWIGKRASRDFSTDELIK